MILDIIFIAFIALSVFLGFKKGLISTVIGIAGFIVAVLMAFMLQSSVVSFLQNNTPVGRQIDDVIYQNINDIVNDEQKSNSFYDDIVKVISGTTEAERDSKTREYSKDITLFILKGISFIGIFILTYLIIVILGFMLNGVFSLPLLNSVNKIGGMGIAFVLALLQIWIVLAILSFLSPMDFMMKVNEMIAGSNIVKLMYENNFITAILASGLKL